MKFEKAKKTNRRIRNAVWFNLFLTKLFLSLLKQPTMQTKTFRSNGGYAVLPDDLKLAQDAITLPEIQEIAKILAKYNLGIAMPHKHNAVSGAFEVLGDDEIQVESDLSVSFEKTNDIDENNYIPVGWVWKNNGLYSAMTCSTICEMVGDYHIKGHNKK